MSKYKYSKKSLTDFSNLIEDKSNEIGLFTLYEKIKHPNFIPNDFYLLILERPNISKEIKQEPIRIIINKNDKGVWEALKINNKSLKVIGTFEEFNILIRELVLFVFKD